VFSRWHGVVAAAAAEAAAAVAAVGAVAGAAAVAEVAEVAEAVVPRGDGVAGAESARRLNIENTDVMAGFD
jgi:hypothetical protein